VPFIRTSSTAASAGCSARAPKGVTRAEDAAPDLLAVAGPERHAALVLLGDHAAHQLVDPTLEPDAY